MSSGAVSSVIPGVAAGAHGCESILDMVPHIVWAVSADGVLEYVNGFAQEYTGQDRERYIGRRWGWLTLLHPDDTAAARTGWSQAVRTGSSWELVYRECMGPSSGHLPWEERKRRAQEAELKADIEYLASEVPGAVEQSLEGMERVASLVRAMKAFSYKDSKERSYADLNEAIRTTVTVARNEVKYVADVTLHLG